MSTDHECAPQRLLAEVAADGNEVGVQMIIAKAKDGTVGRKYDNDT